MSSTQEKVNLKVDFCDIKAARYACMNWHYSKSVPVGKMLKVGAWENDKYIGCVLFSRGATPNLLKPYGLKQDQGCELTRVALNDHKSHVSKILAIAIKFLKRTNPKLELIVSYADNDQNHLGVIYQATNWVYVGLYGDGIRSAFIVKGKKMHPKSVYSKGIKQNLENVKKYLDKNAEEFFTKGKHKYLYPLNDNMKEKLNNLKKDYPKRTKGQELENHSSLGGSTPTCALQTKENNG